MGAGHGAKREGLQDAERRWLVGIDWASQEHVASLLDGGAGKSDSAGSRMTALASLR
jgi:hypothetical protein